VSFSRFHSGSGFLSGGDGDDLILGGWAFDALAEGADADALALDRLDIADLIADHGDAGGDGDVLGLTAMFDEPTPVAVGDLINAGGEVVSGDAGGAGGPAVATTTGAPAASTITILFDDGPDYTVTGNLV
jgi:hypothetical protein